MASDGSEEKKRQLKARPPAVMVMCGKHGKTNGVRWSGESEGVPWTTPWHCFRCYSEIMMRLLADHHANTGLSVIMEAPPAEDDDEEGDDTDGEEEEAANESADE